MGTCGAAMSGMKMAQAHREGQKCSRMDRVNGMEGGLFILAPARRVRIEAQGSTLARGGREALRLIVIIRTRREIHE